MIQLTINRRPILAWPATAAASARAVKATAGSHWAGPALRSPVPTAVDLASVLSATARGVSSTSPSSHLPSVTSMRAGSAMERASVHDAAVTGAIWCRASLAWSYAPSATAPAHVARVMARAEYAPRMTERREDVTMGAPDPPPGKYDPGMCFTCRGTGFCERCNGNGRYRYRSMGALVDCLLCAGSGACTECNGTGRVLPQTEDD